MVTGRSLVVMARHSVAPLRRRQMPARAADRERWLRRAAVRLAPILLPDTTPPLVITVGKCDKANWLAQSWDDPPEVRILISPELVEPELILACLLHEMAHAVVGPEMGHNGAFRPLVRRIGYVGPPTGHAAGDRLTARLAAIAEHLGPYPKGGPLVAPA